MNKLATTNKNLKPLPFMSVYYLLYIIGGVYFSCLASRLVTPRSNYLQTLACAGFEPIIRKLAVHCTHYFSTAITITTTTITTVIVTEIGKSTGKIIN